MARTEDLHVQTTAAYALAQRISAAIDDSAPIPYVRPRFEWLWAASGITVAILVWLGILYLLIQFIKWAW